MKRKLFSTNSVKWVTRRDCDKKQQLHILIVSERIGKLAANGLMFITTTGPLTFLRCLMKERMLLALKEKLYSIIFLILSVK